MSQRKMDPPGSPEWDTRTLLLEAAGTCVRAHGYSGLSTRRVAVTAGMPLSQIHYHFGSRVALLLALLDYQNQRLIERQRTTFAADLPLWQRWDKACDYLDEDIASGYVRILQEMMAAGWSNAEVATAIRRILGEWQALLTVVAAEARQRFGPLGGLEPDDIASLVSMAFLGGEAMLLLGFEDQGMPIRRALRRLGALIRKAEELKPRETENARKTARKGRQR